MNAFRRTTDSFVQGARTMPGEYYTSSDILAEERDTIFARQWNCVGRASAIANPGEYFVREVAGESIIVLRDRAGVLRAFFNVCRHRGTRICQAASGQFSETIQCPYHAWTYATDGRLIGAPHMQDADGFDKRDYPLHAAHIAESHGFLFVNVDRTPEPFASAFAPMLERFAKYDLGALVVGHKVSYDVAANWKLVFQNYSECLHCPTIHPELSVVLPYNSGANDLIEGPFLGGYMQITQPNTSATMSGRACGRPISDALEGDDLRRAYYYTLMPNLMLSIHPDYVNYYLVSPIAPDRTIVTSEWLFHPDNAGDSAFDPEDAIGFWDITNRQDWGACESVQRGLASPHFRPGPFAPQEDAVMQLVATLERAYATGSLH
jgi:Rieske 2Fe-2S family protein